MARRVMTNRKLGGFGNKNCAFTLLVFLFFIPAISMGLIARENDIGTMETMSTLPLSTVQFVLGKFIAALCLILLGLLATSIHFITLVFVGTNIDYGAIFSGYLGLALMGATFAAIGTYASCITQNQVVAFIIGLFMVLIILGISIFIILGSV